MTQSKDSLSRLDLKRPSDINFGRKIYHVLGVFLIIAIYGFVNRWQALLLALLCAGLSLMVDLVRKKNSKFNQFILSVYGPIMRRQEFDGYTGMTFLLIGVLILVGLFPSSVVIHALLFLAIGDPVASYFGIRYGRDKLIGTKTIQGTVAAFVACTVVSVFFLVFLDRMTDRLVIVSLLCGLAGALSELFGLKKIDDNFSMPVLSAIFLWIIYFIFGGGRLAF